MLSDLVGGGYNSALYTALKRRRDLAHDVYAFNYTSRDTKRKGWNASFNDVTHFAPFWVK
jgi:hypothetical protein